ncbi:MAG: nicotinate (nicotinamide) nucleotide adenylyltransferase [Psychroflexus sp.]|nr:nicotinate (nicotinamide) nucleotide adenylyltransferase [Psychroflexus sp.]MDR9449036.1 nicotinate (nicotinamide) nucleotide adenylyltransferase [Psychroflexus sp.]
MIPSKNKKVGLYFGTFNPIHVGHLIIANHLAEFTDLDEVWLVITPQNPFKKNSNLLANHHRYQMVFRATEKYDSIKVSKVEFDLPKPNYTTKTLMILEEKYSNIKFNLIIGEDNLVSFNKWKNYNFILEQYELYICPRINKKPVPEEFTNHPGINWTGTPIIEISSTYIRDSIKKGKNYKPLLPLEVWQYIDEMNFYKK